MFLVQQPAFIWGQCSLVLVTFSWFFHKFKERFMFTCYKRLSSDNLLIKSCLLIPLSHLVVSHSQHSYCNIKINMNKQACCQREMGGGLPPPA